MSIKKKLKKKLCTKILVRGDFRVSGGGHLWEGQNFGERGFVKILINGVGSPLVPPTGKTLLYIKQWFLTYFQVANDDLILLHSI